jgi:hypothetical protein
MEALGERIDDVILGSAKGVANTTPTKRRHRS